jgi:hypothetical protein
VKILKSKKGMNTVVTAPKILVVSVFLAAIVIPTSYTKPDF